MHKLVPYVREGLKLLSKIGLNKQNTNLRLKHSNRETGRGADHLYGNFGRWKFSVEWHWYCFFTIYKKVPESPIGKWIVHSFWKIFGRDILKGSTVFPYGMFQTINNHCFSNWRQELEWVIFFRVLSRGCLHCRLFKQIEQKFSVVPVKAEKKIMGASHSTKTSGLNFRQFPVANGTAFSKKEDNLAMCTRILEKFSGSVSSTET